MKHKKIISFILSFVLLALTVSVGVVGFAANIDLVKTQYVYDESNYSWLRDLIVKEDMRSVSGLSQRNTLIPKTTYPYTETAETFSQKLQMYQMMYTLDDNLTDVAVLYVQSLAEEFVGKIVGNNASDDYVKAYLINAGIAWPTGADANSSSTRVMARLVYAFMVSDPSISVAKGTALNDVFAAYSGKIVGIDTNVLKGFSSVASLKNFKDFANAVCRYGLYKAGYNVTKDTDEKEVNRLMAVYIIKSLGITIDPNTATNDEIKSKFLCVMLNTVYDVSAEPKDMETAVKSNNLPQYMLRVIGKENGVTIPANASYEDAFNTVLKKTDAFKIPDGEFYADIYEYDVHLTYIRDSVWVNPSTYVTTDSSRNRIVETYINGNLVTNKNYTEIPIDAKKNKNTITVTVNYLGDNGALKSTYTINVFQGQSAAPIDNTISDVLEPIKDDVSSVIGSLGGTDVGNALKSIVTTIPFKLPERVLSIATLMLPSIIGSDGNGSILSKFFGYFMPGDNKTNNENINSDKIHGVGGLDSYTSNTSPGLSVNFNQSGAGSLSIQPAQQETKPAGALVVQPEQQQQVIETKSEGLFGDLMNDPKILAVVVVCLVVIFVVCVVVFNEIIKLKAQNGELTSSGGDKQEGAFISMKSKRSKNQPLVLGETVSGPKKSAKKKKKKNVDAVAYTGPTTVSNSEKRKKKK